MGLSDHLRDKHGIAASPVTALRSLAAEVRPGMPGRHQAEGGAQRQVSSPQREVMPSRQAVYCADIGSVAAGHFGWGGISGDGVAAGSTRMADLAEAVAFDLMEGVPVALGFECPLFIPLAREPENLTRARSGEGDRPWSAAAGAGALTTGLAQVVWILGEVRRMAGTQHRAHLDWVEFLADGRGLFLWEAFVSGAGKRGGHIEDAQEAIAAFTTSMGEREWTSAIRCTEDTYSLIGCALLRTGWSSDPGLLSQPCIVVRAA